MNTLKRKEISKWYRNFDDALKGWKKRLELIAPESVDVTAIGVQIEEERNAARRDIFNRNIRVGFDELSHTPVEDRTGQVPYLRNPKTNSSYSEADFRQSDATDIEGVYLESLQVQRRAKTPFLTPTELVPGNRVVIWIKDHFYENQTAVVISYRERTNEYLVEIVTKRPHKRGYYTAPDAKALMYVKLQDVKLCRRSV